jgi:hypothetical protein
MPKILCTIPGMPEEIGGLKGLVKFEKTEAGLVADVDAEEFEFFASIPGYKAAAEASTSKPSDDDERQALLARAEAVNLEVTTSWKNPRLKAEVERAEKAAAEAAGK